MSKVGKEPRKASAEKIFRISVIVWLRLLCVCFSSSGWIFLLENVYFAFYQISMCFIFFGTLVSIHRLPTYRMKMQISIYPIGAVLIAVTIFRLRSLHRRLIRFFEDLLRNSVEGSIGEKCFILVMRRFRLVCIVILPIQLLHYTNLLIAPFIKAYIRQNYEQVNSYSVPYFLTCNQFNDTGTINNNNNNNNGTIFVESLCWEVEDYLQYFVKNFSVSLVFLLMLVPYFVFLMLIAFVIIYVRTNVAVMKAELHLLAEVLRSNGHATATMSRDAGAQKIGREVAIRRKLSDIITYYRKFFRIMNQIMPVLNLITEYFISVFYLLSLAVLAPILKEPELIVDLVYAAKSMSTLLVCFIGFIIFCYGGEVIKETNLNLADAAYSLPWYDASIDCRNLVYSFLVILRKPCRIVAFYRIEMTLRISVLTLYRMYSVLNVVLSALR